jgi:TetR/AcrR family transcriptional repressor of nem operon
LTLFRKALRCGAGQPPDAHALERAAEGKQHITKYVQEHIAKAATLIMRVGKEKAMPYRHEHREHTRTRIVRSARTLFNRHGFEGVSIDGLMAHAGLTRGGFYTYFQSKSELYAEAIALSLAETPWSRWKGVSVDFAADDAARQVVRIYLSREHFDDIDASCPMVALPSDVARSEPAVKQAFESVFKAMVGLFDESLRREGPPDRARALAIAGICVGGMTVARALEDHDLADALREATMKIALQLGGWAKAAGRRSARIAATRKRGREK